MTVNGETVQLGFEYDSSKFRALESGTDSEDFTSEDDDNSNNEGLVFTVLEEPQYGPDLAVYLRKDSLEDLPDLLNSYDDCDSGCEPDPDDDVPDLVDSDSDEGSDYNSDSELDDDEVIVTAAPAVEQNNSAVDINWLDATQGDGKSPRGPMPELDRDGPSSRPGLSSTEDGQDSEESLRAATLAAKLAHLPGKTQEEISHALRESNVVAWSLHELRPCDVPVSHSFELETETPIHSSIRRLPSRHATVVREELDKMLKAGIITPSSSAWSFSVVIASKKDGKPRFCVDYRTLNRVMKADSWPLPKIEELFDELRGSHFFTTLDLFSRYWQVLMENYCKEKTTFIYRFGTFQFEVMPFVLMNAPSTFQRMMDFVFRTFDYVQVYLDDVIIDPSTISEQKKHLLGVIKVISNHRLKLKVEKCSFAQFRVRLLGHIVGRDGVSVDPKKVAAIQNVHLPSNTTARLCRILPQVYRGFANISACLHAGTSISSRFK